MKSIIWILGFLVLGCSIAKATEPKKFLPNKDSVIVVPGDNGFQAEDGDSFWLGAFRLRLEGVDAVEPDQNCQLKSGEQCNDAARNFLSKLFRDKKVVCTLVSAKQGRPKMSYGRYVARCSTGGPEDEVNRLMLSSGLAFTKETGASPVYEAIVATAIAQKKGIHTVPGLRHPAAHRRAGRLRPPMSNRELVAELASRWSKLSDKLKTVVRGLFAAPEK